MLDLEKGLEEVQNKTEAEIEYESALGWGNKSIAAYYLAVHSTDLGNKIAWLMTAEDHYHECREHAALSDEDGEILKALKEEIYSYRQQAISSILEVVNIVQPPQPAVPQP
jgi:hypothetical protein